MSNAWTGARAQAALGEVVYQLLAVADALEAAYRSLPRPPDLADREEGRLPYNVATEILATIECVLEDDLRPAIQTLQRAAQITDAELEREFRAWKRQWRL
jgi:hypothetical protein